MDAQVKRSLDDTYRAIDRCVREVHKIRIRKWADAPEPERRNHQVFTNKKKADMEPIALEVVGHLDSLRESPLARDSRDPANKELNGIFEGAWLMGLRLLATTGSPDARRMHGHFQEGRRSPTAWSKARIAIAKGGLSRLGDDR